MDRITEVTRDCFNAVIQLRRVDPSGWPAPQLLQQRFRAYVDRLLTRASQAGLNRDDADAVAYAVVALIDEVVASSSDALRDAWAGQSLQLHYFKENVAGEAFFERLAALRRDPRRREVLQAYFLALQLGFQGRYRVRGGDLELLAIVDELRRDLSRGRTDEEEAENLSPNATPPDASRSRSKRAVNRFAVIALAGLALALVLHAGLRLAGASGAADSLERIRGAVAR